MNGDAPVVPVEVAKEQVRQMGMMMASLYRHLAQSIVDEIGEERGKEVISRAIENYGSERGEKQRQRVLAAGHAHEPQNYGKLPDLPSFGWDVEGVNGEDPTHIRITYCPFAAEWRDHGFEKLGRLYCAIDQAKYEAFHPDSDLVHLKNVLDGDRFCEIRCQRKDIP
ncbi:L-2-amino-thiazoline-4-carboxylic acid hydrolase [Heliobacterium chlorum]|uniref:L-2-amino-thiazoline-4-carboxylic acid hydrolase n=1 Tax=Heliobacterium chlorum TaxID=2698 RepID=A0ABR7T205_HELCL|nr:L-2-amino-thiazoline-4-carboxylic acid hydrolase [Heliobacterium chlorum]MBC9784818.1 L-2-amino-thiazoline-4-carboxylic acid hydrolase [Heliobacterium chlorum]